jgi:hypothetical protein
MLLGLMNCCHLFESKILVHTLHEYGAIRTQVAADDKSGEHQA